MAALLTNPEQSVRLIGEKEYIVINGERDYYIQDFIRFPVLIGVESETSISSADGQNILKNAKQKNARGAAHTFQHSTLVTGDVGFPNFASEKMAIIGVHRAIFHPLALYAIATDLRGSTIPIMRRHSHVPVGLFEVRSNCMLVSEWARKSSVGIYKLPMPSFHCANELSPRIQDFLTGYDHTSAAMCFANRFLRTWKFVLHAADLSFQDQRPGSIPIEDRFCYAEHIDLINYLRATCHVILRNGGEVYWTKGSMCSVPGAKPIDKIEAQEILLEGTNGQESNFNQ